MVDLNPTYFSEYCINILPQRVVVFDGFTNFSHLLQRYKRVQGKNSEARHQITLQAFHCLLPTSMTSSRFSSASAFSVISLDALK